MYCGTNFLNILYIYRMSTEQDGPLSGADPGFMERAGVSVYKGVGFALLILPDFS